MPEDEVFLGGLDTKGSDGKLVCIWHDDVMQVCVCVRVCAHMCICTFI